MKTIHNLGDWLDERIGWRASWRAHLEGPTHAEAPWSAVLGTLVVTCFVVLTVTGVALMTTYAPSPQTAWASVHYTQYLVPGGRTVRGLHSWAAQALLLLCVAHAAQGAFAGSYRSPREIAWWLTLLLVVLAIGESMTGGLLPWDQRGWWARRIEANIVGLAPAIGGWLRQMMLGGSELGALGLTRAYAAHVVALPLAISAALWGRRSIVRRHGWTEAKYALPTNQVEPLGRAAVVAAAGVGLLLSLATTASARLDAPADPTSDYPARPEWFLLALFELRRSLHGAPDFWETCLLPAMTGLYLALLPALDTRARPHKIVLAPIVVIFGAAISLGAFGWYRDAHDVQFVRQRAKADARADAAIRSAMAGIPPAGALDMMRRDPDLHGRDLFDRHCASCHVLGELGDPTTATGAKLDGWGTPEWIKAMIHDPDANEFFGTGPYKGLMPSVDVRPKDNPPSRTWSPMIHSDAEATAVAMLLASQGDEPDDPPRAIDERTRLLGTKIVTERCVRCHLYMGEGDDEGKGTGPELWRYGSLSWTRTQVANPESTETYRQDALDPRREKHMPRFDVDLSPADIDIVARWTRTHARAPSR